MNGREASLPQYPYLGLAQFEGKNRYFGGREQDLDLCRRRIGSSAVRVLVLQGLSGSGKSSFLRASLLPRLSDDLEESAGESAIVPISGVVTSGPDMFAKLARQVYECVVLGTGRRYWREDVPVLEERYPDIEEFVRLASDPAQQVLLDFIAELSNNPKYSALLTIDQVEEFWAPSLGGDSDSLRNQFLDFVRAFALEKISGKLVLSIRTEQYGVFASKMPTTEQPAFADLRPQGVNRLVHHYLADPSRPDLLSVVVAPTKEATYRFSYEAGLPEAIVNRVMKVAAKPGMCILPLLQVVLLRLYIHRPLRTGSSRLPVVIERTEFEALMKSAGETSTGIISDFVSWGLGRAVSGFLREDDGPEHRSEVACWHQVLRRMSASIANGLRSRLRLTIADIEKLARDAGCRQAPSEMVPRLCEFDVGLMVADGPDSFMLRHDLLCLTLDQAAAITGRGFWEEADRNRRARILRAMKYVESDLFEPEDLPVRHKLKISELRFWDHKTLLFAKDRGLFARLGFDVNNVTINDDVTATQLVNRLRCDAETHALFSFPRALMSDEELSGNRDVVILNSFTGFAVICNEEAGRVLPHIDHLNGHHEDGWTAFRSVAAALVQLKAGGSCSFVAEEDLARKFFEQMIEVGRLCDAKVLGHGLDDVSRATVTSQFSGDRFVEHLFRTNGPCVAIVTAPTWALAMLDSKHRMRNVIDQRWLLGLLDAQTEPTLLPLRRKLEVRNAMNLRLAQVRLSEDDQEAMEMRLASVGLFLADSVWAQDAVVGEWIRMRWEQTSTGNFGGRISEPIFRGAFRRSCSFVSSEEYGRRYFGRVWDDRSMWSMNIHHKMMQAQMDYERGLTVLGALLGRSGDSVPEDIDRLVRRARKHADINNFYDACRFIGFAQERFDAMKSPA